MPLYRYRYRFRLRLRRHPVGFWLITLGLAAVTAVSVLQVSARADAEVARWGRLRPTVVMARPVEPGVVLARRDVRVVAMPARLVPAQAAAGVDAVVGRAAAVALWPGEVVLQGRLAPDGLRGVAALVPPGMRAVAVPVDDAGLHVAVGDAVDVLATFDTSSSSSSSPSVPADDTSDPTVVVAAAAPVLEVASGAVTIAVPADDAPRVAFALARATITLALTLATPTPSNFSTAPAAVEKIGGGW
ncbi:MAG: pilus assembly protein CpaB [Acidimicrobiaceae bacterium]|nr:pilus assembly protein CpaB [Acidimicrobiaceae bacterium]